MEFEQAISILSNGVFYGIAVFVMLMIAALIIGIVVLAGIKAGRWILVRIIAALNEPKEVVLGKTIFKSIIGKPDEIEAFHDRLNRLSAPPHQE